MPETVLVVDDEPFILRSLSFVLERAGFLVRQARNGDEALEVLRDARPRVAILDVMMPKRSGFEVCEIVKGDPDLRGTYVILLTAKGQESARERGLLAGADEYMTKPFSTKELERAISLCEAFDEAEVVTSSAIVEYLENNGCTLSVKRLGLIVSRRKWFGLPGQDGRVRHNGRRITIWSPGGHQKILRGVSSMDPAFRNNYLNKINTKLLDGNAWVRPSKKDDDEKK